MEASWRILLSSLIAMWERGAVRGVRTSPPGRAQAARRGAGGGSRCLSPVRRWVAHALPVPGVALLTARRRGDR